MGRAILSLVALVVLTGCGIQRVQMETSPALAQVVPMRVTQAAFPAWKAPLSFGAWRTQGFYKNAERVRCSANPIAGDVSRSQRFRFALAAPRADQNYSPDRVLQAECVTTSRALTLPVLHDVQMDIDGYPRLECTFSGLESGKLEMVNQHGRWESGTSSFGTQTWTVRAVVRSDTGDSNSHRPLGYEILAEDAVVAAVETINGGRVWIAPVVESDTRVAALATALLLYDQRESDAAEDCQP